jgi:hypothetical protein
MKMDYHALIDICVYGLVSICEYLDNRIFKSVATERTKDESTVEIPILRVRKKGVITTKDFFLFRWGTAELSKQSVIAFFAIHFPQCFNYEDCENELEEIKNRMKQMPYLIWLTSLAIPIISDVRKMIYRHLYYPIREI